MGTVVKKHKDKAVRKSEIIAAAEKIFFKSGIHQASMDAVASEADVSKGTLYLYFKNKNALYRAILRRAFETLEKYVTEAISDFSGNGKEKIKEAGKAYIKFSKEHPGYFDAILHYENDTVSLDDMEAESLKSMIAGNQVLEVLANVVKAGMDDGSIGTHKNPIKLAIILWGSTTGMLQMLNAKSKLLEHYYNLSEEEMLEDYFEVILKKL
ncbi:TetR/AcrR family transcriptional regulator [Luteibaculum oceani]|uniref:TetR/AcrR family transcriptional regulator n=1 Tax=Luteibaculum oceani TaxID=1294296 RepID=A0A5C6UVN3_9FLAO|nr:TetR/AcrR family transcriptional regulator [Luteibaculum oceani]TXC77029.1 TetR/AcrR family transcriptional regulator [Luteibaculum oceani]